MKTGTVKWFNAKRGYGFITGDDGEDAFVHYTGIVGDGFKTLKGGQAVTYDLAENPQTKKMQAENVQVA